MEIKNFFYLELIAIFIGILNLKIILFDFFEMFQLC